MGMTVNVSSASAQARASREMVAGVAGRISGPPYTCRTVASRYRNLVTTPKLPPPPRIAQNRSGSCS